MSLNQIQLTNQQLTSLYADVLIESTTATSVPEFQPVKSEFQQAKYLGKNAKNILLLVNNTEIPYLPDNELSFLTNILSACKLSLADVAIMNLNSLPENEIEAAIQPLEPKHILLFGMEPLSIGLPINFPPFQLQPFNKRIYLCSPTLQELEQNKELKLRLWNSLKTLFGL
jgi:hypothetical protein